jgi:SAM-dependent methyltransferase
LQADFEQNAAFHNRVAPSYDARVSGPNEVLARKAFQALVARYVPAGSTLLDFGCGTGLDAMEYARLGYRVLAYDNSRGMVAQLEQRCAAQIASGRISTSDAAYPAFPKQLSQWPAPHAVTANFAVLNSIRDLQPLFEEFAGRLAAPGWMIVSLLNPIHWSKMKTRDWWRDALRHPRGPRVYTVQPSVSYLHFVPALLHAAKPFRLVGRANAGALVRYDAAMPPNEPPTWWMPEGRAPAGLTGKLWHTPAYQLMGHFMFLVLRRDP